MENTFKTIEFRNLSNGQPRPETEVLGNILKETEGKLILKEGYKTGYISLPTGEVAGFFLSKGLQEELHSGAITTGMLADCELQKVEFTDQDGVIQVRTRLQRPTGSRNIEVTSFQTYKRREVTVGQVGEPGELAKKLLAQINQAATQTA